MYMYARMCTWMQIRNSSNDEKAIFFAAASELVCEKALNFLIDDELVSPKKSITENVYDATRWNMPAIPPVAHSYGEMPYVCMYMETIYFDYILFRYFPMYNIGRYIHHIFFYILLALALSGILCNCNST